MVCGACEKKLGTVICPDPFKSGARNTVESGKVKVNENKALSKAKRYAPYSSSQSKCKICKTGLHQEGMYCQGCAYTKGLCSMCGKQILDVKNYKQSAK